MIAIDVQGLGKAYKQYERGSDRLAEWLLRPGGIRHRLKWALKDVTFTVAAGEAVGIIGVNGAGKSTLLKLITGTTQPTAGHMEMRGRVAALLELGMGFHPEFSGRENAIMAAQLSGLHTETILRLMPEIEAFAEIGDYIDKPVRTYSSGMRLRLAFSVAVVDRPDILIIDEALSVGDAYFQYKCMSRIREFQREGTSLLFVSHDPGAVKSLCTRAILLHGGLMLSEGKPDQVLDYYNAMIARKEAEEEIRQAETSFGRHQTRSGNRKVTIDTVDLESDNGESIRAATVNQPVALRLEFSVRERVPTLTIGMVIRDRLGNDVFGTNTHHLNREIPAHPGAGSVTFRFPASLGVGTYSVSVAAHTFDNHVEDNFDWHDNVLVFEVVPGENPSFVGTAFLPVELEIGRPLVGAEKMKT